MRFKVKTNPVAGTLMQKRGFLFFPKQIGLEWRWLETALWLEKWERFSPFSPGGAREEWVAVKWIS